MFTESSPTHRHLSLSYILSFSIDVMPSKSLLLYFYLLARFASFPECLFWPVCLARDDCKFHRKSKAHYRLDQNIVEAIGRRYFAAVIRCVEIGTLFHVVMQSEEDFCLFM